MRTACSRGQLANGGGSGGTDRGRGVMRTPACRQEGFGGGAVGRQGWLACCGEKGSAWHGSAVWAKTGARRGGSCARLQLARSRRAQCTPTICSAICRGLLGGLVGAGD